MLHIATWIDDDAWPFFERTFARYPDVLLWNARIGMAAPRPDGLLLSGGCDISREWLQQPVPDPTLIRHPEAERDAWEFYILPLALERSLPIFAICRGVQVLNVALGGTLHLDIPGHAELRYHNVQPLVYLEARHAEDGTVEQVRLRDYPFCLGVQYHPERDEIYRSLFDAFVEAVRASAA